MASRKKLIRDYFEKLFSVLNEAWVRGELAKLETGVEIRLDEIEYALEYTYSLQYAAKQKRFEESTKVRGETNWPLPAEFKKNRVFKKAAQAAMARGRAFVLQKGFPLDPIDEGPGGSILAFYTPNLSRDFFRELKTGGMQVLESNLKTGQRITTVQYLMDYQGYDEDQAKKLNEDWKLRSGINITHQGWTTSGAALGSVALQTVNELLTAHDIPRKDFSQFFKEIVGVFETEAIDGQFRVAVKNKKKIAVRAGAAILNQRNKEAGDLSEYKQEFIEKMIRVLEDIPTDKLVEMLGISKKQITENIGTLITKEILSKLTSREITARVGILKWANAFGVNIPRGIKQSTYKGSRASLRKTPIYTTAAETKNFNKLSSLQANKLYTALKVNLREHIYANMRHAAPNAPADPSGPLTWRTGRFGGSVRVESVKPGKGLLPIVRYDYMRYPYQVFERGHPMYRETWDPYDLINKSIREIAKSIEITKLRIPRVGDI